MGPAFSMLLPGYCATLKTSRFVLMYSAGSESSAATASVGPAQGGSVLSDGTYLGSAASRQDASAMASAGVMLDEPVLSGATAASGATLSSGEPPSLVPCGHIPQHSSQFNAFCPSSG